MKTPIGRNYSKEWTRDSGPEKYSNYNEKFPRGFNRRFEQREES